MHICKTASDQLALMATDYNSHIAHITYFNNQHNECVKFKIIQLFNSFKVEKCMFDLRVSVVSFILTYNNTL